MPEKILIIISTAEAEKVTTALMYAYKCRHKGWFKETKVVFFGPSQKLVLVDDQIKTMTKDLVDDDPPYACKTISDQDKLTEETERLGLKVEYIGSYISHLIKEGYTPLIF